jgi:hypothetical protein
MANKKKKRYYAEFLINEREKCDLLYLFWGLALRQVLINYVVCDI